MKQKYQWSLKDRYIQTSVTRFHLSSNGFKQALMNIHIISSLFKRLHQLKHQIFGPQSFQSPNNLASQTLYR